MLKGQSPSVVTSHLTSERISDKISNILIILRRVRINGPIGLREIDMILDTGAVYTVISWDVVKDIGYDPADRCSS